MTALLIMHIYREKAVYADQILHNYVARGHRCIILAFNK